MNIKILLTMMHYSMGGMVGARFGPMYPKVIHQFIPVDLFGFEHWVARGVPFLPVDPNLLQSGCAKLRYAQNL